MTITIAIHYDHLYFRRLLTSAFSQKALTDQELLIKQYIDLLIQRLHEHTDTKQNMWAWFNVCVYVDASLLQHVHNFIVHDRRYRW